MSPVYISLLVYPFPSTIDLHMVLGRSARLLHASRIYTDRNSKDREEY